jgi:hypothetical protein
VLLTTTTTKKKKKKTHKKFIKINVTSGPTHEQLPIKRFRRQGWRHDSNDRAPA